MIIIMGVSGTGKTSLGKHLSQETGWPFYDADDFHPETNKKKMSSGLQLDDADRAPWLAELAEKISLWSEEGQAILACSALKERYRESLAAKNSSITWVVLKGSFDRIKSRLESRENHFFNTELLRSQFDVLELPNYGIHLNIEETIPQLTSSILNKIQPLSSATIGVIGMGVMGQGIALNCAENNISTAVYNRSVPGEEKIIESFLSKNKSFKNLSGFTELNAFVSSLEQPRKIWLMIKSGSAIDALLKELTPLLSAGDIVVDGGNSHYPDTQRRAQELQKKKIDFVGCGVSGGEVGARNGASIMFGGSTDAYTQFRPILNEIAAKDKANVPCQSYMGKEGAGHFVKMVHNGIEYAEMQLLAETFAVLANQMSYPEIVAVFQEMNQGSEASYLLEITAEILQKKEGNRFLVDLILDQASSKGTGMWSSSAALALGSVNTMMSASVFARYLSSFKTERVALSARKTKAKKQVDLDVKLLIEAYRFARIVNHIQGFNLIENASQQYGWEYSPSETARIWTQGCIIRSRLMETLVQALKTEKSLFNNTTILDLLKENEAGAAFLIHHGVDQKIALDCYSSAYNYWVAMCSENLPANLIQAQRDFFGAHTYRRVDKPFEQTFHTQWQ